MFDWLALDFMMDDDPGGCCVGCLGLIVLFVLAAIALAIFGAVAGNSNSASNPVGVHTHSAQKAGNAPAADGAAIVITLR